LGQEAVRLARFARIYGYQIQNAHDQPVDVRPNGDCGEFDCALYWRVGPAPKRDVNRAGGQLRDRRWPNVDLAKGRILTEAAFGSGWAQKAQLRLDLAVGSPHQETFTRHAGRRTTPRCTGS